MIDSASGNTTLWMSPIPNPLLEVINETHCRCSNVLKGVNYYISLKNNSVLEVKSDVYFSSAHEDFCDKETIIEQAFSVKFGDENVFKKKI